MSKYLFSYALLLIFGLANPAQALDKASLEVTIPVFRSEVGHVLLSVFNDSDPKAYPEDVSKAVLKLKMTVPEARKFVIEGLPVGDYALAVLHDENDNGEMDKSGGLIKKPKEDFGFSNNAMGSFGPPFFKSAKLTLTAEGLKTVMKMKYMSGLSVKERSAQAKPE